MTRGVGPRVATWGGIGALLAGWGPAALWLGIIAWLSHQPRLDVVGDSPDWLLHAVEYGLLGLLMGRGVARSRWGGGGPGAGFAVVGLCAILGALDEYHQSFIPGRDASARDVLFDAAGAAVGTTLHALARRRIGRKPAVVVLVGKADCHLCDEAEAVLREVLPEFEAVFQKVDLDQRPGYLEYRDEIPVVLLNGRKAFKYRVDPERLRRRLSGWRRREIE